MSRDKIELTGVVLSGTLIGDYDKRLVIYTKERGKITAFAKGARRAGSSYMGVSEPMNFGIFSLYEGFDAYRFAGGDIKEHFTDVKNDIEGACYGTYFCEILEYLSVEGMGDVNVLNLIYLSLKALNNPAIPNALVRRIFELKLLTYEGYAMQVFGCASCGDEDKVPTAFSLVDDGLVCKECANLRQGKRALSQSSVYTLQYIVGSPLESLYSFTVTDRVMDEICPVIDMYFKKYAPYNFKSLGILESLIST